MDTKWLFNRRTQSSSGQSADHIKQRSLDPRTYVQLPTLPPPGLHVVTTTDHTPPLLTHTCSITIRTLGECMTVWSEPDLYIASVRCAVSVSDEWVMRGERHMEASMKLTPKAFAVTYNHGHSRWQSLLCEL